MIPIIDVAPIYLGDRQGFSGAVASMYALVIVVGLIGVAVNVAARATERRALRRHPSVRGEAA